jgi:hypothetical protein
MLFGFYDLPSMIKRILFGFYHLAKNIGGEGVSGTGVRTGPIPDRLFSIPIVRRGGDIFRKEGRGKCRFVSHCG